MNEPVTQHSLNTDLVSLHDESASLYVKYTGNWLPPLYTLYPEKNYLRGVTY